MTDIEYDLSKRAEDCQRVRDFLLPLLPDLARQEQQCVEAGSYLRAGYVAEEAAGEIEALRDKLARVVAERDQARRHVDMHMGHRLQIEAMLNEIIGTEPIDGVDGFVANVRFALRRLQDERDEARDSRRAWAEEAAELESQRDDLMRSARDRAEVRLDEAHAQSARYWLAWQSARRRSRVARQALSESRRLGPCCWWEDGGRRCPEWRCSDSDYCEHHTTLRVITYGTRFARWEHYDESMESTDGR